MSLFTLLFAVKDIEELDGPKEAAKHLNVPVGIVRISPFVLALAWPVYWGIHSYFLTLKEDKAESPESIIDQMEEDF